MTHRTVEQTRKALDANLRGDETILLGPWLGEVGYELLYWIPFLAWVQETYQVPRERFVALSRGGVGSWYADLAGTYLEQWDLMDRREWTERNAARGRAKQIELCHLEAMLISRAQKALGRPCSTLHPSTMYHLFRQCWLTQLQRKDIIEGHTIRRPLKLAPGPQLAPKLPKHYVAVKAYLGDCLPADRVWDFVAYVTKHAQGRPIVTLETGLELQDGHTDCDPIPGCISAQPWMTATNNLEVQTQVIAGADEFIGPAGGITWLAPRLRVTTRAIHADGRVPHRHIAVARAAFGDRLIVERLAAA